MKILIFVLTMFFTNAYAATYFPVNKNGANAFYPDKSKCESIEGVKCFDVAGKDMRFHILQTTEVDDISKPIYRTQYDVEACQDANECQAAAGNKVCDDNQGDYPAWSANDLMPGFKAFCTGVSGYEKKEVQELVLDSALQAQINAADAVKQANETAIQTVKRMMKCGEGVKAIVAVRNVAKNFTTAQVKEFTETFSVVKSLLEVGALITAKAEVQTLTPDGTLTTQEDKDAVISAIDACLAGG